MASRRDQLRAMSKKNLETHQQTTLQPTLVTDVVNQLNTLSEEITEDAKPIVEAIPTLLEQQTLDTFTENPHADFITEPETTDTSAKTEIVTEAEPTSKTESISETEPANDKLKETDVETIVSVSSEASVTVSTEQKPAKKNKPSSSKKMKKSISPNTDTYTGREITVTLLLSEEVAEFLFFKSIELGIPAKKYFKELMVNEIENGVLVEDDLTKSYRKTQHDTIKKSIPVNEDLKTAIKEAAMKYRMRYTTFMAYVLDKARLGD